MTEVIKLHTVRFIVRSPRMGDALGILICSNEGQRYHNGNRLHSYDNISEAEGKIRGDISNGNYFPKSENYSW